LDEAQGTLEEHEKGLAPIREMKAKQDKRQHLWHKNHESSHMRGALWNQPALNRYQKGLDDEERKELAKVLATKDRDVRNLEAQLSRGGVSSDRFYKLIDDAHSQGKEVPKPLAKTLEHLYKWTQDNMSTYRKNKADGYYELEDPTAAQILEKRDEIEDLVRKRREKAKQYQTEEGEEHQAILKEWFRRNLDPKDWDKLWDEAAEDWEEYDYDSKEQMEEDPEGIGTIIHQMVQKLNEKDPPVLPLADQDYPELHDQMAEMYSQMSTHTDRLKSESNEFERGLSNLPSGTVQRWKDNVEDQIKELGELNQAVSDNAMANYRLRAEYEGADEVFQELYDLEEAENQKVQYDQRLAQPEMAMIISRAPIDLVRMSDHPNAHAAIESCLSVGGGHYQCAVDEAHQGGAIAYLVSGADAKKINTEADEIFEDQDRNVRGIKPYSRVRLHRLENYEGNDIAIPAAKAYGFRSDQFVQAVLDWARRQQPEAFDALQKDPSYELVGGGYVDAPGIDGLASRFLEEQPEPEEETQEEETQDRSESFDSGVFWDWMHQTHPQVTNPNPDGREQNIAPDTLRGYAEEEGPHKQRAIQMVQQYMRQYQQAQQGARQAAGVANAWLRRFFTA
jgi:hypothetical protein